MKKIQFLFVTIFLVTVFTTSLLIFLKSKQNTEKENNIKSIPEFTFRNIDSTVFSKKNILRGNTIFYFYDSQCSECKKLAKKMANISLSLENYEVLWISQESTDITKNYAKSLNGYKGVFLVDNHNISFDTFGINSVPTLLIYKNNIFTYKIRGDAKESFLMKKINE